MSTASRRFWEIPVDKVHLKGHTLELTDAGLVADTSPAIQDIVRKVNAEMERLHRLAPEPPTGYHWSYDYQQAEDLMHNRVLFRAVARLEQD